MNAMQYQLEKLSANPDVTAYYLSRLAEFAEGEWIRPTNATDKDPRGDSYTIFSHLYELGLVQRQAAPIWRNASFCGQRVTFRYRLDLNYGEATSAS